MPYKELCGGNKSIYDNIDESFTVPGKVILYLQTKQLHLAALGSYQHPFKDQPLLGPYLYTDGEYYWDRDTWEYVLNYHVKLPDVFITKVMSEAGTDFLERCAKEDEALRRRVNIFKKKETS